MNERTQDAYNEWLLHYGYRTVTFSEVCDIDLPIEFMIVVDKLKKHNALKEVFNKEQNTHNYTLLKLN